MKRKEKENKALKLIRFIVLVLFIVLLFAPGQIERTVIALAGTAGSIFFLLVSMLPRLSIPAFLKNRSLPRNQKQWEEESESGTYDMETLLIRQVSFQITDKLKAAFPEATWEFTKPLTAEQLLKGKAFRVHTIHTGDYNFAEITLDKYGHLNLAMMTLKTLTPQEARQTPDSPVHIDPEAWYSLIGRPLLMELIGDLQARGHQKLFINEAGDIFILNGNTPEVKNTFEHFPPKDYWAALTDIFIRDELKAKETENTLELSWV